MRLFRQGDVLLKEIVRPPTIVGTPIAADMGRLILAYGEVTGHAHEVTLDVASAGGAADLSPALFVEDNGRRLLYVNAPCALVHQEHGAIALLPGCYEVVRQREYSPEAIWPIAD